MITALPALVKDQVLGNFMPSAEAVVEVDPGTRAVEEDVRGDGGLGGLSHKQHRRLQLEDPELVGVVTLDECTPRLLPACTVVVIVLRVSPRRHCTVADERELVVNRLFTPRVYIIIRAYECVRTRT
jgi:hypothetical protein